MEKNERFGEDRAAVEECRRCLDQLRERCPSIYGGLLEGLASMEMRPLANYLHFMRDLISRAPEGWHESDLVLDDHDRRRQRTNAHLLKRLERRSQFCSFRASLIVAKIDALRERAANSEGDVARAYAFAARRMVCLVSSFLRVEAGIHIVSDALRPVPSPRTCILPPRPPPPPLAKVLPFKRPSKPE